jgi:hypothetical protein
MGPPLPGATRELGVAAIRLSIPRYTPSRGRCQLYDPSTPEYTEDLLLRPHADLRGGHSWRTVICEKGRFLPALTAPAASLERPFWRRAEFLFEWSVLGTSLVSKPVAYSRSRRWRHFTVFGTFAEVRLTQIQNAVFLCYIAVVPQGREAPRRIARFSRRFALPAHRTTEVGA